MIAMHYTFPFPNDYPMDICHWRIREEGAKTDGFPGLILKAYMIAEKSRDKNVSNSYAPFYLWESAQAMNRFVLGGMFEQTIQVLGWHPISNWQVFSAHIGAMHLPQYAVLEREHIRPFTDLEHLSRRECEESDRLRMQFGWDAMVRAYNPLTWELCRFQMGNDPEKLLRKAGQNLYRVLHVSRDLGASYDMPEKVARDGSETTISKGRIPALCVPAQPNSPDREEHLALATDNG